MSNSLETPEIFLIDLPLEILIQIVGWLNEKHPEKREKSKEIEESTKNLQITADKHGQSQLLKFAMTNKEFCRITLPVLWRNPRLKSVRQLGRFISCTISLLRSAQLKNLYQERLGETSETKMWKPTITEESLITFNQGRPEIRALRGLQLDLPWFLSKLDNRILSDLSRLNIFSLCQIFSLPVFSSDPDSFTSRDWDLIALDGNVHMLEQFFAVNHQGIAPPVIEPPETDYRITPMTMIRLMSQMTDNLVQLSLPEDVSCVTNQVIDFVADNFPHLKTFAIGCNRDIVDSSLIHLVSNLVHLQVLRLGPAESVTDAFIHALTKCRQLKELVLVANRNITTQAWVDFLALPSLTSLMTIGCLNWNHYDVLYALSRHPNKNGFKDLSFGWMDPDDATDFLCRNHHLLKFPNLKGLFLRNQVFLTDLQFATIVKDMPLLERFDLAFCNLGDEALIALAESCPLVNMIDLEFNQRITNRGLKSLLENNLYALDVSQNHGITQNCLEKIPDSLCIFACEDLVISPEFSRALRSRFGVENRDALVYWDWDFEMRKM